MSKKDTDNFDGLEKLFGSKSRVKLLQLFFQNVDKSFYVREVTRLIDEQINSVRRELTNMQKLGVLKSDTYDNKLYYAINQNYAHHDALKLLFSSNKDKTVAPKKSAKSDSWDIAIKPIKGLVELFLLIENKASKHDIDMFIVGDDSNQKISKWAALIEKKHGRPLNYAIITREDYFYRHSIRDRFVHGILEQEYTVIINKDILRGE